MKVNPQTDELLSAFLDGELSPRQQTEVQRMAAHDPDMAQRLQQLRGCRTLINVLPRADAPADLLEQVKLSLERRSLLEEHSVLTSTRAGVRHLRMRRFLAAAAMIALVGVLGLVIYQIVSPVRVAQTPVVAVAPVDESLSPAPIVKIAAGAPFSGRLELATASLDQVYKAIRMNAEDNELSCFGPEDPAGSRVVCRLVGSPEKLEAFLTGLNGMSPYFGTARLLVETDRFAQPVIVDSVTLPQVAGLVNQNSAESRVQAARNMAVLNQFAREIPGREIQVATSRKLNNAASELVGTLKPLLAQGRTRPNGSTPPEEGEVQVKASLTIVLRSAP